MTEQQTAQDKTVEKFIRVVREYGLEVVIWCMFIALIISVLFSSCQAWEGPRQTQSILPYWHGNNPPLAAGRLTPWPACSENRSARAKRGLVTKYTISTELGRYRAATATARMKKCPEGRYGSIGPGGGRYREIIPNRAAAFFF